MHALCIHNTHERYYIVGKIFILEFKRKKKYLNGMNLSFVNISQSISRTDISRLPDDLIIMRILSRETKKKNTLLR